MLRRYQNFATWTIKPILAEAVRTARVAFELPDAITKDLAEGCTRAVRRRAYKAAWEHIKRKDRRADAVALADDKPATMLIQEILNCRASIKEETDAGRTILDRLTGVQWPLYLYLRSADRLATAPAGVTRKDAWGPLLETGGSALDLCEACSEVLEEAGLLRSR